jgi:hypothetical protein
MRLVLNSEGRTSRIVMSSDDVAVSTRAPALIGLSEQFAKRWITSTAAAVGPGDAAGLEA